MWRWKYCRYTLRKLVTIIRPRFCKTFLFKWKEASFGLIGPNGAGKSTTIKGILGLLKEMKGTIEFFGERKAFAYIPEHPILYDDLTLWEHLELTASVYEMEERIFQERAEALLKQFRFEKVKHHLPGSFSKGMQQKMMLIIGFLNRPDVYIVDEPFIGLDPYATKDLLHMLETERERGVPILMSTHVLDTAERVCDRFVLISNGTLAAEGTLDQIRDQAALPSGTLLECFHEILQQKGMGGLPDS